MSAPGKDPMKSKQVRVTIIILVLVFGLVGYYSYLAGRIKGQNRDAQMTAVEKALSRDLVSDYPPTPREVMRYYNEIMMCYYSDDVTDDEIDALGIRARALFDPDLKAINEETVYLIRLHSDIKEFKESGKKITNASAASSTNVDYYERNGYQFARLLCTYNINESGSNYTLKQVYLLRKDSTDKHWKIFGWDLLENVDLTGDGQVSGTSQGDQVTGGNSIEFAEDGNTSSSGENTEP